MKIGEFAEKYGLETSKIRYYIEAGLLLPSRHGSQFRFGEKDCREMELVLELKKLGFSIKEILSYINVMRSYNHGESKMYDKLLKIIRDKKKEHLYSLDALKAQISSLDVKENEIRMLKDNIEQCPVTVDSVTEVSGIPLEAVPILRCPDCGCAFSIENSNIIGGLLTDGVMSCRCGYTAYIRNGMLYMDQHGNLDQDEVFIRNYYGKNIDPTEYEGLLLDYITDVEPEYLTDNHKARCLIDETISGLGRKFSFILLPDVASQYLYYFNDREYLRDAVLVIAGLSESSLRPIRRKLNRLNPKLKVIYIVSPSCRLPFSDGVFDLIIDHNGSFNLSFFIDTHYYDIIGRYAAEGCVTAGATDYYLPGAETLERITQLYPSCLRGGQTMQSARKGMVRNGFRLISETEIGQCTSPGKFFEYHIVPDVRGCSVYLAEKQ
ncbi:MAG: MerR family transcriptional regulator [Lentihominibacter sp.]